MIDLQAWVGRQERVQDTLDRVLVNRIATTFSLPPLSDGDALPALWHWAFFINPLMAQDLGADGHPALGGFMPPALGRQRMWAGGRVRFIHDLRVGMEAERVTTIKAVQEKAGRTGSLLFVTLLHQYFQAGALKLEEEQDIVYRSPSPPKLQGVDPAPDAQWSSAVQADAILLFRYSAVTFNGHRIHYDYPYSTQQEGYPGLVVHGPLIATLLLHRALAEYPGRQASYFSYRGMRPLIAPAVFQLEGRESEPDQLELWAQQAGSTAQQAQLLLREA